MSSLSWSSTLSVASVFFIVFAVAASVPDVNNLNVDNKDDMRDDRHEPVSVFKSRWFAGVGAMGFAFVCEHSSFIVYSSLGAASRRRWQVTSNSSIGIALCLSLILVVPSYLYMRDEVKGDILNGFNDGNAVIVVARLLLAVTMVFTYPMEQFVARHCIFEILESQRVLNESNRTLIYYSTTVTLWFTSLVIGASVTDLGIVLELVGALGASMLGFILPGLVVLKCDGFFESETRVFSKDVIIPIFLVIFGCLVFVMGTITALL